MTLTEYLHIIKCDDEQSQEIDEDVMSLEYREKLEDRINQNQAKRKASNIKADIKDFING